MSLLSYSSSSFKILKGMLVGASMSLFQTLLLRITSVVAPRCLLGKTISNWGLKVRCHCMCLANGIINLFSILALDRISIRLCNEFKDIRKWLRYIRHIARTVIEREYIEPAIKEGKQGLRYLPSGPPWTLGQKRDAHQPNSRPSRSFCTGEEC